MNYGVESFDKSTLTFDPAGKKYVTFQSFHRLFTELLQYIAKNLEDDQGASYIMDILPKRKQDGDNEDEEGNEKKNDKKEEEGTSEEAKKEETKKKSEEEDEPEHGRVSLRIGYGQYRFKSYDGETLHAVYQHIGKPVGNGCGVELMSNLVIFTEKNVDIISKFLTTMVDRSELPVEGKFTCFKWNIQNQYWQEEVRIDTRSIESVVLPKLTKDKLIHDVEKFLSKKTSNFYHRNGIPYRRSYLFYGIPGSGKTSLVQALASYFERNLCYLIPTHPEITDDSLREAMNQLPLNSIVIFEDIDALFSHRQKNETNKSSLTFSGLLNALDGIGSPAGQIFILTTNLRDHLDDALIRNGRVDLHIEFTYATVEQMEQMWKNFYPDAPHELASKFSSSVEKSLRKNKLQVSTAGLQHFFITQMDHTAEEALQHIHIIIQEIKLNHTRRMLDDLRVKDAEKQQAKDTENKEETKEAKKEESTTSSIFAQAPAVVPVTEESNNAEEGQKKKKKKNNKNKKNATQSAEESNANDQKESFVDGNHTDVVPRRKTKMTPEEYQEFLRKIAEKQAEKLAAKLAAKLARTANKTENPESSEAVKEGNATEGVPEREDSAINQLEDQPATEVVEDSAVADSAATEVVEVQQEVVDVVTSSE